jgi:HEAT repeat protein
MCFLSGKLFAQNADQIQSQTERLAETASLANIIATGNSNSKRDALFKIRNLKTAEASQIAVSALNDSDEIVRATATHSIIYLPGDEAVNLLLPLLKDKSELVRRETAYALGKIHSAKAVNYLLEILQKDKILEVRNACVIALGEIGEVAAVEFLLGLLKAKPKVEDEFLRRSASRSIGQIAKNIQTQQFEAVTPESFLPEKFKPVEKPKYPNISDNFPSFRNAVSILSQILQNPQEAADTKREAAFALGEIRDQTAVVILQKYLTADDYYLTEICREAIKKIELK